MAQRAAHRQREQPSEPRDDEPIADRLVDVFRRSPTTVPLVGRERALVLRERRRLPVARGHDLLDEVVAGRQDAMLPRVSRPATSGATSVRGGTRHEATGGRSATGPADAHEVDTRWTRSGSRWAILGRHEFRPDRHSPRRAAARRGRRARCQELRAQADGGDAAGRRRVSPAPTCRPSPTCRS